MRLPSEWETQSAVMLTWPHANTDWVDQLAEVQQLYTTLIATLLPHVSVVLVIPPGEGQHFEQLKELDSEHRHSITFYEVKSNDTWARDHGPISVIDGNDQHLLLDFTFNGWGDKFEATYDNQISRALFEQKAWPKAKLHSDSFILEGGAIESDGQGLLLTTEACLLNPNRNTDLSKAEIENKLKMSLGITKVLWLRHGKLKGDDTDSHIDTVARFAPNNGIVYVGCDDESDEHYLDLRAMENELRDLTDQSGKPFTLFRLPWPEAKYDDEERLPATYANYLITNNIVIVPTYNDDQDDRALEVIASAYPDHQVCGLNCMPLIKQHGSLHCITMQIPKISQG